MACSTCRQGKCVCAESTTALGLTVDVVEPSGDELNASELADLLPCDSTSCSSTPADPNACCNYFNAREGENGDSFFYSAGGPFKVTLDTGGSCPPDTSELVPLADGTATYQNPGVLQDIVCMDLQPGTYKFDARFELHDATPGTRVVVLFRPDCTIETEYLVSDCAVPCAGYASVGGSPDTLVQASADLMCSNFLVVPSNTCNPGFRILAIGGRRQTACEIGSSDFSQPYLRNVQILVERVTSRDLVECNTSAIITGVESAHTVPC